MYRDLSSSVSPSLCNFWDLGCNDLVSPVHVSKSFYRHLNFGLHDILQNWVNDLVMPSMRRELAFFFLLNPIPSNFTEHSVVFILWEIINCHSLITFSAPLTILYNLSHLPVSSHSLFSKLKSYLLFSLGSHSIFQINLAFLLSILPSSSATFVRWMTRIPLNVYLWKQIINS